VLIRQPVDIGNVDLPEAQTIVCQALQVASSFVEDIDLYTIQQLARATVAAIHRREARGGLKLGKLLDDARVGGGYTRDKHFTSALTELASLAVRVTAVMDGRGSGAGSAGPGSATQRVRYEHFYVKWARAGRERNALATDRIKNVAPGIRFAGVALACDDRHLPALEIPFTTGTRHDYASARADPAEIARIGKQLGRKPNGPPVEHLSELLHTTQRSRARLERAVESQSDLQRLATVLSRRGFSDLVVVTRMPCGPAPKRQLEGADMYKPGLDTSFVELLEQAGKQGVAHMGSPSPVNGDGFEPRTFDFSTTDRALANDVEWDVAWHWHAQARCLRRVQAGQGIVRTDDWRVIGLTESLEIAVALVRRHERKWTDRCLVRSVIDTAPGLIKASSYRSDVAMRDLLRLGNAGIVGADRLTQARHAAR
jgi:hypothetical protein